MLEKILSILTRGKAWYSAQRARRRDPTPAEREELRALFKDDLDAAIRRGRDLPRRPHQTEQDRQRRIVV